MIQDNKYGKDYLRKEYLIEIYEKLHELSSLWYDAEDGDKNAKIEHDELYSELDERLKDNGFPLGMETPGSYEDIAKNVDEAINDITDSNNIESSHTFAPKDMDALLEGSINFGHNGGNDEFIIVGITEQDAADDIGVSSDDEESISTYMEQIHSDVYDFLDTVNDKLESYELFIKPGYYSGFQVNVKDKDYYDTSEDDSEFDSYKNVRDREFIIVNKALHELINNYGLYEYSFGWMQSKINK